MESKNLGLLSDQSETQSQNVSECTKSFTHYRLLRLTPMVFLFFFQDPFEIHCG